MAKPAAVQLPPEFVEMKAEIERRMRVATEEILRSAWKPYAAAAAPGQAKRYEKFLDDLTGASMIVRRGAVAAALELAAGAYGIESSVDENEAVARMLVSRRKQIELAAVESFRFESRREPVSALSPAGVFTRVVVGIAIVIFGVFAIALLVIPSPNTTAGQRMTEALVLFGIEGALVAIFFVLPRMALRMSADDDYWKDVMRRDIERRYADADTRETW